MAQVDLDEAEARLLERLLNDYRTAVEAANDRQAIELVEGLLHKLSHPVRGVIPQDAGALLTDVDESIPRPTQGPQSP